MAKGAREETSLKRSEVVTIRLDPKLKYLAELAARRHRRTLSSYIEWAVEQSLSKVLLEDSAGHPVSVVDADRTQHLWDVYEPDRVARLALNQSDLLTHEEQIIWKLVSECPFFWRGRSAGIFRVTIDLEPQTLRWMELRKHWLLIRAVANGTRSPDDLPSGGPLVDDESEPTEGKS